MGDTPTELHLPRSALNVKSSPLIGTAYSLLLLRFACSGYVFTPILTGVPGCAAECRRVRGMSVGAAREADLWDFCGARGRPKWLSQLGVQRLGRWALPALLIAGADNPEHLALLFADELVEGERWLVAVRGLDSPACGAFCCLGHYVVNVVHPRDPIVRIGEAGANPQSRRPADISPPGSGILGSVEPGYYRPVPS